MKKYIFSLLMIFAFIYSQAQITINNGARLVVASSTIVVANDGVTSNSGTIENDGTIINRGDLINNTSTLFTAGSTGTFIFEGTSMQKITGDHDVGFYGTLKIDNAAGVEISNTSTGAHQTVNGLLILEDGIFVLNDFNLIIGASDPTGISPARYIQTNDAGSVYRDVPADGATLILYPVGETTYNPIVIKNGVTGATDSYGVKAINHEPANSNTPHMVNRSWEVTETTPGGSELTVTPQWIGSQELTGFNRDNSGVGKTTDAGTTYEWSVHGPSAGTDPYTQTGSTFGDVGTFAVADYYYSIPEEYTVSGTTIGNGETDCFDAKQILTVAGDGSTVDVMAGGDATFVAGGTIYLQYGFHAHNGSIAHAYITLNDQFCGSQPAPLVSAPVAQEEVLIIQDQFRIDGPTIKIYPNPTSGRFNIEFSNFTEDTEIHIVNFQGQEVLKINNQNRLTTELNISHLPKGIYMIIVESGNQFISGKVIKS